MEGSKLEYNLITLLTLFLSEQSQNVAKLPEIKSQHQYDHFNTKITENGLKTYLEAKKRKKVGPASETPKQS